MVVLINWFYRYFTFDRGTRIIIKRGAANIVKLRQSVLQQEMEVPQPETPVGIK